ncbi:MAG: DUF928 domain-containing protein [Xenococcaceae cyanobacterium MO_188.B32]|nr:DUF928 domain-containing protein [Xenococcaceae cyanobacterium MO_188.B32]
MILTIWRSPRQFWLIFFSIISSIGICYSVAAKEIADLPPAPTTGTPEGTSSTGGTRGEPQIDRVCNFNARSLVYLLNNGIRDFTISAYPIFWFYSPYSEGQINYLEFTLAEVETTKTIYRTKVNLRERSGIMGIALPQEKQYALKLNQDYSWSLQVYCSQQNERPDLVFEGWLRRLPITSSLQKDLAAFPSRQYSVYLENNILYDALTNLTELRQKKPNDPQIIKAWNQLLIDLGRKELISQPILEPVVYSARDKK